MSRRQSFHLRASRDGGQIAASTRQGRRIVVGSLTATFVAIGGSESVLACPMCFGAEETSLVNGTKLGILALLAIVLAVQAGFVAFFLYLRRQARCAAEIELETEWSELQRPSRT